MGKYRKIIVIMAGILSWLTGFNGKAATKDYKDDKFKAGQVWHYHTRQGEESSTILILKVEKYDDEGIVLHVYVNGLKIKNNKRPNGISEDIGHLPFSKEAVLKSVTTLVSENNKLPDFQNGYKQWKQAFDNKKGGIFSIDVKEAVKYVDESLNQN